MKQDHASTWPLRINASRIEREHLHHDFQLLCVLEGVLDLSLSDQTYAMKAKDLVLVNSAKRHGWVAKSKQHLVCEINLDSQMLSDYLGLDFVLFWCNSVEEYSESYNALRNLVYELLGEYALDSRRMSFQARAVYYQIVDLLLKAFLVDSSLGRGPTEREEVIYRAVRYIHLHYRERISLEEVAGALFISASTLSRQFKARIGMNFVEYVNDVRLQHAVDALLFGAQPITAIAADSGYSNLSLFNRAFKRKYQVTPSEFKKQMKNRIAADLAQKSEEEREDVRAFLEHLRIEPPFRRDGADAIEVDVANAGRQQSYGCDAVYMGHASLLLMSSFQKHTLLLKEELGFRYLQVRNLLSHDMRIRSAERSTDLNFEQVNNVLDFLVENGITPMIDLGEEANTIQVNMENILLKEEHAVFYLDAADADYVLRRFIRHIVVRYGQSEVDRWMFYCVYDVRTERIPAGTHYSYPHTVENVIHIIREVLPHARVGVFGHRFALENHILLDFLRYWRQQQTLPDFILLSVPPYRHQEDRYVPVTDTEHTRLELEKCRKVLAEQGFGALRLYLHGWNTTLSDRSCVNDSCAKAAGVVAGMLDFREQVDLVIYDYGSDISSVHYDQHSLLIGGRGLLTKDGFRKPVCHAMHYLSRVGGQVLARGRYYVVTTNGRGEFHLLLCNHKRFNYQYFLKEEHEWEMHELDSLFENSEERYVSIRLQGLKNTKYSIKRYVAGVEQVSLIREWQRLGMREIQTREELAYLGNILVPRLTAEYQTVLQNEIELQISMQAHEVTFIAISVDNSL